VDLSLGAHCNNDCVFCMEGGRRGARRVYSLEEAARLLEQTAGLETVFLTGGEPTLNPDLLAYVDLVRARGVRHVALITNGRRLARRELAEALLARGVSEIRVSVHGHTAALHEAHSGAPGSFAQVERGLAHLRELRAGRSLHLIVLVVVTRLNLPHVPALYEWARASGADRVGFGVVRPSGRAAARFDELIPRYADVGAVFRPFLASLRLREDPVNVDSLPPCLIPADVAFVGARMRLVSLGEGEHLLQRDEFWEKTKGPPCAACVLRGSCEGVWEGYAARHGWDEFRPFREPPWGGGDAVRCAPAARVLPSDPAEPFVSLGGACNSGCPACPPPAPAPAPELPALLARLERLARAGAAAVRLGGGEPTLHPQLPAVLQRAAALGLRATLCTNARWLAYPRAVARLAAAPPARLVVALLGADPGSHDSATRAEGSFRQSLAGVRNARRAGWPVTVGLPPGAEAEVARLRKGLAALGCEVVELG
jgi:cyclic pyranopterin phosphate synthase